MILIRIFLGFILVAFRACAEHGLRKVVTDEHFCFLMKSVRLGGMTIMASSLLIMVTGVLDRKKL